MAETFIELWSDTVVHDGQRELRGDKAAYDAIQQAAQDDPANVKLRAVAHNRDSQGALLSTMFHVAGVDQADIDALTGSHADHDDHGVAAGTYRGLELRPGTPTDAEVDDLAARIQADVGEDITTTPNEVPPGSGQSAAAHLKNDRPSIGQGNWQCQHPDHDTSEVVSIGGACSLGHGEDDDTAEAHVNPFDATEWTV